MDKKTYKGTTFTRNPKNFKDNVWKAKKLGLNFQIFRKSFAWRIEVTNSVTSEIIDYTEHAFTELEDAFEFIVSLKKT
jgi:hypothetical protein